MPMSDERYRQLHPCAVCEREQFKAMGSYAYRQLSVDDLIEHLWHCEDPDEPKFNDEAFDPF